MEDQGKESHSAKNINTIRKILDLLSSTSLMIGIYFVVAITASLLNRPGKGILFLFGALVIINIVAISIRNRYLSEEEKKEEEDLYSRLRGP